MAFPVIRDRLLDNPGTSTTSITVTKPPLLAPGELWLIAVCRRGSTTAFTWPAGFTALVADADTSSGLTRLEVRYRIADGTETNIAVTQTDSGSQWKARSWRISVIHSTPPQGATNKSNTTNANPPILTPSWGAADTLWLAIGAWDGFPTISAAPASYDNFTSNTFQGSSAWARIATAERTLNAASENPGTFTSDTEQWVAATIAVRPGVLLTTTLDPVALPWTGATLVISAHEQMTLAPAALTWTGATLIVNERTQIPLNAVDISWTGQALSIDNALVLTPGALSWTGVDLAINARTQFTLEPALLTWTGKDQVGDRWRTYPLMTMPTLADGQATGPESGPQDCLAVDTHLLLPADQWASVRLDRVPSAGVICRADAPEFPGTFYGAVADSDSSVIIYRYANGVNMGELERSGPCLPEGKTLILGADGATLTASLSDGIAEVAVVTVTSTHITTGGFAGISTDQSIFGVIPAVDNFASGDFSIVQGESLDAISASDMQWTGQALTVNAISALILDAMAMPWTGQSLSFLDHQLVTLDPMSLTWTGQNIPGTSAAGSTGGRRVGVNRLIRA